MQVKEGNKMANTMTDDEFAEIFSALTESNKAILLEMVDRLLTEQIEQERKSA